jgi:hypothetical protein
VVSFLNTALGYLAAAYVKDTIVRPKQVAKLARDYCNRVGKPLLNVNAGTARTSLRATLFGPTLWGDVNLDPAGPRILPGPRVVSFGDPYDLRRWPDRYFGAVIAAHVLERLDRPDVALTEWRRVADKVFVVVPPWWAPHAWLHPEHKWFIDASLKAAYPVWTDRQRVFLLPVSDRSSSRARWNNPEQYPSPLPPSQSSTVTSPSAISRPNQSNMTSQHQPSPTTAKPDIASSPSVSTLMVVSSDKSHSS